MRFRGLCLCGLVDYISRKHSSHEDLSEKAGQINAGNVQSAVPSGDNGMSETGERAADDDDSSDFEIINRPQGDERRQKILIQRERDEMDELVGAIGMDTSDLIRNTDHLSRYTEGMKEELNESLARNVLLERQNHDSHIQVETAVLGAQPLRLQNQGLEQPQRILLQDLRTLKQENTRLEAELKDKTENLESTNADLLQAQNAVFKKARLEWPIEETRNVRNALETFYKRLRSWAKEFSKESINGLLAFHCDRRKALTCQLQGVADLPSLESLEGLRRPFLILAAVLAKHLYACIFSNPFFIFSDLELPVTSSRYAANLGDTFQTLLAVNPSGAHTFRTQLLRAAFPSSSLSQDAPSSALILENASAALYDQIVSDFMVSAAAVLILKNDDQHAAHCQNELLKLVHEAGRIATHLATQRKFYVWEPSEELLGRDFTARSDYYRADKLNRVEDEEDSKCDGMPIRLLLSHAVRALRDNDGQDGGESLLVANAIVWVDDRKEDVQEEEL